MSEQEMKERRSSGRRRKMPSAMEGFDLTFGQKRKNDTEKVSFNMKITYHGTASIAKHFLYKHVFSFPRFILTSVCQNIELVLFLTMNE